MSHINPKTVDPDTLKNLIAGRLKIDEERISIRSQEGGLQVGVAALTEPQQRAIYGGLRSVGFTSFEVVEDPAPGVAKTYPLSRLTELLAEMGEAPDSQLDKHFASECANFSKEGHDLEETLRFIRNMRDKCVFAAGGSPLVMKLWDIMLEQYPEPKATKKERRKELDRWAGMG